MSRSQPNTKNPAVRYFNWAGGEEGGGRVTYWDKAAEERKEVDLPWSFLVLDELNAVGGYSDSDKSSFWSNEVRNMKNEAFTVRTSAGVKARGLYSNISDEIKAKGAKYAKSVYIAFKDESGELVIGNIKLMGAALTAWIEFNKKFDTNKCATFLEGGKKAKKGSNIYYTPIFDGQNVSEATEKLAQNLDKELQAYFKAYFEYTPDDRESIADDDDEVKPSRGAAEKEVEIEDIPEEESKEAPINKAETKPLKPNQVNVKDVDF